MPPPFPLLEETPDGERSSIEWFQETEVPVRLIVSRRVTLARVWDHEPGDVMMVPGIRVSGVATVEERVVEVLRHAVLASRARERQSKRRKREDMVLERWGYPSKARALAGGLDVGEEFLEIRGQLKHEFARDLRAAGKQFAVEDALATAASAAVVLESVGQLVLAVEHPESRG